IDRFAFYSGKERWEPTDMNHIANVSQHLYRVLPDPMIRAALVVAVINMVSGLEIPRGARLSEGRSRAAPERSHDPVPDALSQEIQRKLGNERHPNFGRWDPTWQLECPPNSAGSHPTRRENLNYHAPSVMKTVYEMLLAASREKGTNIDLIIAKQL